MATSLIITDTKTVNPDIYTWDSELSSCIIQDNTNTRYVSGHAPYTCVTFSPLGTSNRIEENYTKIDEYIEWDFGDKYNVLYNKILLQTSSFKGVSHTYIMPGIYDVSYKLVEVFKRNNTSQDIKWINLKANSTNARTWRDAATALSWSQSSRCDTGCMDWSINGIEKLEYTWNQMSFSEPNSLTWFKQYTCNNDIYKVYETQVKRQDINVTISEIAPKAYILCSLKTGTTETTATFSASGCLTGSFPIEEIVWDFNDTTPSIVVNRHSSKNLEYLTYNNFNSDDIDDPRNYDVTHIYKTNDINEVFYPCMTLYSSNTNTKDAACDSIGPFTYTDTTKDIDMINARVDDNRVLFGFKYDNSVFFNTINLKDTISEDSKQSVKVPSTQIKRANIRYIKNIKNNIKDYISELIENKIITEENNVMSEDEFKQYIIKRKQDIERSHITNEYNKNIASDSYNDITI